MALRKIYIGNMCKNQKMLTKLHVFYNQLRTKN